MDCYYAAIEQRDHPQWQGKPVIVSGPPNSRAVVATASYEARKYGVHSAMNASRAYSLCPEGIFTMPRFDVYKQVSTQIRAIFYQYTDLVEPLSLDEAYLDVSTNKFQMDSALEIAKEIKLKIKQETGLVASAGVSVNKFVAKVASDWQKPDGLTVILPQQVQDFIAQLPIEKFYGVGKVTAAKMHALNIKNGFDLKLFSKYDLEKNFGKSGAFYYQIARGIDDRPVVAERQHKSIAAENTFAQDLILLPDLLQQCQKLAEQAVQRLHKYQLEGKTITLKIRYSDFSTVSRSKTLSVYTNSMEIIKQQAEELFLKNFEPARPIRLLGITISNFKQEIEVLIKQNPQLSLDF